MQRHCAAEVEASPLSELAGHARHAPWSSWPVALLWVSFGHGIALPAEHQYPASHAAHSELLLSPSPQPTLPAWQGVGAEEPSAHHDESVHTLHAVAPSAAWKEPALHRKQVLVAAEGATLPGAHADGNLAPAAHA